MPRQSDDDKPSDLASSQVGEASDSTQSRPKTDDKSSGGDGAGPQVDTDGAPGEPKRGRASATKDEVARLFRLLESNLPEPVRVYVTDALIKALMGDDGLVKQVTERNLPKEAALFLASSADSTRKELLRVVSRETRRFLENVDLGGELTKILTSVSFEVTLKAGFVPNQKRDAKPSSVEESNVESKDSGLKATLNVPDFNTIEGVASLFGPTRRFLKGVKDAYHDSLEEIVEVDLVDDLDDTEDSDELSSPYDDEPSEPLSSDSSDSTARNYRKRLWNVVNDRLIQPSLQADQRDQERTKKDDASEARSSQLGEESEE